MADDVGGALGSLTDWERDGTVSSVAGADIFWRQDGPTDGSPITLLHGFPTSSHDWAAILPRLTAAGHRVTMLDFHGFGASAKPTEHRYLLTDQAAIVESLWAQLSIGSTALVAHDYGTSVAQELLARDPGRFTSVSFLNGGVYPDLHRPIPVQRLLHSPVGPVVGRLSSERMFRLAMHTIMHRPVHPDDVHAMWLSMAKNSGKRVQHDLLHYIDERKELGSRWVAAMEGFTGPLQFIWGPKDPVSGAHVLERIRQRLPGARFDELTDVGHYPQVEAPETVAVALLTFLAEA